MSIPVGLSQSCLWRRSEPFKRSRKERKNEEKTQSGVSPGFDIRNKIIIRDQRKMQKTSNSFSAALASSTSPFASLRENTFPKTTAK
jgi:hypothetical protein